MITLPIQYIVTLYLFYLTVMYFRFTITHRPRLIILFLNQEKLGICINLKRICQISQLRIFDVLAAHVPKPRATIKFSKFFSTWIAAFGPCKIHCSNVINGLEQWRREKQLRHISWQKSNAKIILFLKPLGGVCTRI